MPPARIFVLMHIHYREMLKQLEEYDHERSQKTFTMKYMACNREKQTGGQIIHVTDAKKSGLPYHCADHEMRGYVTATCSRPTAFHLRLVFEFNGLIVYP